MSARTDLTAYLSAHSPESWWVSPYADEPTITTTTVMTNVEKVEPAEILQASRSYTINVLVLSPKQIEPDADLEDALDTVLGLLENYDFATWTTAERVVAFDIYPAYKVTAIIHTYES